MAAGAAYFKVPTQVSNNAFLDLRTTSPVEVVIHNVYFGGQVNVFFYDGTNSINVEQTPSGQSGALTGNWHCSSTVGLRIQNISGGAIFIGADGMETSV